MTGTEGAHLDRNPFPVAGCDDATLRTGVEPTTSAHALPRPGDQVERRYRLRKELGRGGFGTVFEAHDAIEDGPVAIKFISLRNEQVASRYERELATLRRARVPGIAELLDDGRWGDHAFLVMRLVQGARFPGDGVNDTDALLARTVALFESVQRLHAAGVLHRDIKPANVLVSDSGQVTIVDLGIAEDETDAAGPDGPRRMLGTPLFMAPERLLGGRATVQSDLFAAATTVAMGLAAVFPDVEEPDAVSRLARGRALLSKLPQPIQDVLEAAMHRDPAKRPATAGHVLQPLREHLGTDTHIDIPLLDDADLVTQEQLRTLVRTSNRIFFTRDELARVLWERSRGRPRIARGEIEAWIAAGLATWDDGLLVEPAALQRIVSSPAMFTPTLPDAVIEKLSPEAHEAWNLLTLAGTGLARATMEKALSRDITDALTALRRADAIYVDEGGLARVVVPSPSIAAVDSNAAATWAHVVAGALPSDSLRAFHLLASAGEHERACHMAIAVTRSLAKAGRHDRAYETATTALHVARIHLGSHDALYDELLEVAAGSGILRAQRSSIDGVRYHAELAPRPSPSSRCWTQILAAAARVIASDPQGALHLIDKIGTPPTTQHHQFLHTVANLAALRTRSAEVQRTRLRAAARWIRTAPPHARGLRGLLSAWTGWLRFQEGNFDSAASLHGRAARLAASASARTSALCNAAAASIEACRLGDASRYLDDARTSAIASLDSVNLAQVERLSRVVIYRQAETVAVDEDLLGAVASMDRSGLWGLVTLGEAAIAWRHGDNDRATWLAGEAEAAFRIDGANAVPLLAAALAEACRGHLDRSLSARFDDQAQAVSPVGVAAQAAALRVRLTGFHGLPNTLVRRSLDWAVAARCRATRREVLSPEEVIAMLGSRTSATGNGGRQ